MRGCPEEGIGGKTRPPRALAPASSSTPRLAKRTDLYYLRARYYDPSTGRFLTRDPTVGSPRAPQWHNRYADIVRGPFGREMAKRG